MDMWQLNVSTKTRTERRLHLPDLSTKGSWVNQDNFLSDYQVWDSILFDKIGSVIVTESIL